MVASVSVEVSQSDVDVAFVATSASILASQSDVTAIFNVQSESVQIAQADVSYASLRDSKVEISQADVMAIFRGRPEDTILRSWTFSLDGHDFYVLRLGDTSTLVYDLYSEQWMEWQSPDLAFWRANVGINWNGGEGLGAIYGSNAVVGDDFFGVVWFLDPTQGYDQNPREDGALQFFERVTMGQMPIKGREVMPCYVAWLTGDMGAPAYDGAGVRLLTSDDGGATFDDQGLVTVTASEFTPEVSWYSLGQIGAPGRLFKIVDDGAVARIDGLEMNDPDDDG
jgi:hypothetical protein